MPNPIALAALGGLASAALFLTLTTGWLGVPIFSYFVQLPLFFVGLTLGLTPALAAAGSATLVVVVIGSGVAGLAYLAVEALPVVLVVRQALLSRDLPEGREWYPPGPMLMLLTLLAGLGVLGAAAAYATTEGGLVGVIEPFLREAMRDLGAADAELELGATIHQWARLVPALMAVSWIVMVVVNGALAQGLAMRFGRNLRPAPDIVDVEVPRWCLIAVAAFAAASLLAEGTIGFLGQTFLLIALVPYCFQGLAVIHAFFRHKPARRLGLALTYLLLVFFSWPLVPAVVVLGFVEDWARLRRRFVQPGA